MYISKDSTLRFKDDPEDSTHFGTKTLYFRYYSDGLTFLVSSFGPPRALCIKYVVDRSGDTLTYHSDYISDDIVDTISDIKNEIYDLAVEALSEAHPSEWSRYFFGNVVVPSRSGKVRLNTYIMDLNDVHLMPREEIASHLEELMGPDLPRIPVNPMAWILEDRPVEVVPTDEEIDYPSVGVKGRSAMIGFTPSSSPAYYSVGGTITSSDIEATYVVDSGYIVSNKVPVLYESMLDAKKMIDEYLNAKEEIQKSIEMKSYANEHTLTVGKFKQYWTEGHNADTDLAVYKAAGLPPSYIGDDFNAV